MVLFAIVSMIYTYLYCLQIYMIYIHYMMYCISKYSIMNLTISDNYIPDSFTLVMII